MKKVGIVILLCILFIFVAYKASINGYIRLNYPSFQKYPVHGIDVSHHQKEINWDKLDKDYTQFVFIKATEGATHQDSNFEKNWAAAKQLNIPTSAYHFFTFCTSAVDQAQNYIDIVPNDSTSLPPSIDLEYGGNCREENRLPNLRQEIITFINILEAHYNKRVIIYTTSDFYEAYIKNDFPKNPIWIRNITSEPKLENNRPWLFWQYANKGRLNGIEDIVDINVFNGNKDELLQLTTTFIK